MSGSTANIKIEDVQVKTLEYDFTVEDFKDEMEEIKKLLPPPDQTISFVIRNANTAIANAMRRTAISELEVKALDYDFLSIETNEREIMPFYLHDRIKLIPVDQECDESMTFSVDVANNDPNLEKMRVTSEHIKPAKGAAPFGPDFCIAMLGQGCYLRIPAITISKGIALGNRVEFSLTGMVAYEAIDYKDINFLNEQGNILHRMIKTSELNALLKGKKIKDDAILIVPNPDFAKIDPAKLEGYTVIEHDLPWYSSAEVQPRDFALKFQFHRNIDPKAAMIRICESLIGRLKRVKAEFEKPESETVRATKTNDLMQIYIAGETYTMGRLLYHAVYELDPACPLVNMRIEHPLNISVILNVKHPDVEKIVKDAFDLCINRFELLKKQF